MPQTIMSKIKGVSYKNDDGSDRQTIIRKYVDSFSDILLEHDVENEYSDTAIAVYVVHDILEQKQIGFLSSDLGSRFYDQLNNIDCFVEEVTGEDKGTLGVNIRLVIYTDEEMQEKAVQNQKVSPIPTSSLPMTSIGNQVPKPTIKSVQHRPIKKNISPKSRTIALILCVLFGYFGGHQFYAGRKGIGILYIFTVGLFLFGWIIDFVLILLGQYKDKNGRYISAW